MGGFVNAAAVADALNAGQQHYATWRKSPTQPTTLAVWFDLSMSPGNPVPQYYAASPLRAIALAQSTDGGLPHGGNVAPRTKHLHRFTAMASAVTALPMPMILADYLMYYPFVDEGTTDPQAMDNTVTLPRWTDGAGVQMMAVSVAARTGGQTFRVTYTNSAGVGGRVTQIVSENTVSVIGSIVTSETAAANARGPFIPLQAGDTGVRSIESVQMISGPDVGLFTLVLVKPIAQASIFNTAGPTEVNYLQSHAQLPVIADDAYLNILALAAGALNATNLHGDITTVWSN